MSGWRRGWSSGPRRWRRPRPWPRRRRRRRPVPGGGQPRPAAAAARRPPVPGRAGRRGRAPAGPEDAGRQRRPVHRRRPTGCCGPCSTCRGSRPAGCGRCWPLPAGPPVRRTGARVRPAGPDQGAAPALRPTRMMARSDYDLVRSMRAEPDRQRHPLHPQRRLRRRRAADGGRPAAGGVGHRPRHCAGVPRDRVRRIHPAAGLRRRRRRRRPGPGHRAQGRPALG